MKSKISNNFAETQSIGKQLGRDLKQGTVIALYGELGAGKTTFVQGMAKSLGVKNRILSPTFIIVRKYKIDDKRLKIKDFYHIDLYRIENEKGLEGLGIEEVLSDKDAIVAIEWAEKLKSKLPKKRLDVYFEDLGEDKRKITWNK
ncbi:MAG: tRNA (adenosine(37)-N6)-threonylcarbamoyltransferase complex ATPase subunit type 1 TsaE [Candidatus Levyibacteriota bacterium]